MKFELTILGCNAALPANGRHPSAQVLNIHEELFLIDCGEGTQIRMNDFGIKKNKINHIFISHLHGDHIFGLIGLMTSMSLANREKELHIHSPIGLSEIIEVQLRITKAHITYPFHFHEIDPTQHQLIFENKKVEVFSLPLLHRIPASGFLFREKPFPLNMNAQKIEEYNIPFSSIPAIKSGEDFITPFGKHISNNELTLPPKTPRSFAYCSDTAFAKYLTELIQDVDLLYHEATFATDELEQAKLTMHSTAHQAAIIAIEANAKQLIIGHYSSRYLDLNILLNEAKEVFVNTLLAEEGKVYAVNLLSGQKN